MATERCTPTVLFATAEFGPYVKVGGLGEASSGLVGSLSSMGVEVTVVMPDFGLIDLTDEKRWPLTGLPSWCPPIEVRSGRTDPDADPDSGGDIDIILLSFEGGLRSHPYVDPSTGESWPDATWFYMTFSAGVAALAAAERPDVVHLNDWHTSAALLRLPSDVGSILTVHNLAYQGVDDPAWLDRMLESVDASALRLDPTTFLVDGAFNSLAGGISGADRIVLVSESYRDEAISEAGGFGLHHQLRRRGDLVSGIRNGIDLGLWHPADDLRLPVGFDHEDLSGKEICRKELLKEADLDADRGPVIGMVARLVHQKGIDLALDLVPFLDSLSARMVLMGSGSPALADKVREMAELYPNHFAGFCDYDETMAHLIVGGSDLLLMPSRFEPCGLTQLQAMTCGTIPVVTAVGGLRDTVVDTDACPRRGTGFVAEQATSLDLLNALHRACRGWSNPRRRAAVQRRGMTADWSWTKPARQYLELYRAPSA
ncbi:MAG: glycogen synthase [Acidimicrobiia bacterium]|nr:glycogen synthase [Acidimicrobiia bacterium]